jgi:hypothetical protein
MALPPTAELATLSPLPQVAGREVRRAEYLRDIRLDPLAPELLLQLRLA